MAPDGRTMFGRPTEPITEAVHALPYPQCPNVVIAYPSFGDWFRLYDPSKARGFRRDKNSFEDLKRNHEKTVTRHLDEIARRAAGMAVLEEIKTRSSYSVMILPFDFLPSRSWGIATGAVAKGVDRLGELAAGVPICGKKQDGKHVCIAGPDRGTGGGSAVDIYFTARRFQGHEAPDEALLHELLHASRKVKGVLFRMPMDGGYGNQEEFLAVLAANIYRSEKGATFLFDYKGGTIDSKEFLDKPRLTPTPRLVIAMLRKDQPSLFSALARIPPSTAAFNPIRQVDAESRGLMRKIEGRR